MARIDIDDPYTAFLEKQVKAGLYNTISEAARDAIRKQMDLYEVRRLSSIQLELAKGEKSILTEATIPYTDRLMTEISEAGRQAAKDGKSIRNEVRP